MAVLAGFFLMLPGIIAAVHGASDTAIQMPVWLMRDLVLTTLAGMALLLWGGASIRNRELALHEIPARR